MSKRNGSGETLKDLRTVGPDNSLTYYQLDRLFALHGLWIMVSRRVKDILQGLRIC
jgi:hypothetical protein